jgi:capsular exopolysaccharide synthesis family protein
MSRIHEALKKAEQERGGTVQVETAALPNGPVKAEPSREYRASAGAANAPSRTSAIAAPAANSLQFDDLVSRCAHPHWHPDPNENVFLNPDLSSHAAEQFRTLRSRLYQLGSHQHLRTMLITSSIPAEGKTFMANNLAQAIAQQPDCHVLMIDADLRCSRLHVPLGAPSSPGLTDYLRGEADEIAIIQHGQEGNLCFIPGGREVTDASELLSNGRLKMLLDSVTPAFDWVIIDSPPILPVADSIGLADLCEGVLLVVRSGSTPTAAAQRTCQELQKKNVVGVVLNAVSEEHTYSSYYGHYGYTRESKSAKDSRK